VNGSPAPHTVGTGLPRQLAPGTVWLGDCLITPLPDGSLEHSFSSAFLVSGEEASLLVDTGHPKDWAVVKHQLESILADRPPLRWVVPTHAEVTHAGNLGRLLATFPDALACGDIRDYHLLFPGTTERLRPMAVGDEIDLGGRVVTFVDAVFRDLPSTLWLYEPIDRVLYTGDGLGFGHYHHAGQCGKLAEEVPDLEIPELTGIFAEYALYWTRLKNVEPYIARLDAMMQVDYPVDIVASAHGNPVTDPTATMPKVRQGLRQIGEKYSLHSGSA
jgi:flavorubredoxin